MLPALVLFNSIKKRICAPHFPRTILFYLPYVNAFYPRVLTIHSPCLQDRPATASPPTAPNIPQPSVQDLGKEAGRQTVNPHTGGTDALVQSDASKASKRRLQRTRQSRSTWATCSLSDKFPRPVCVGCITEGGQSWRGAGLGTREELGSPVPRERQCRHIWSCGAEMGQVLKVLSDN